MIILLACEARVEIAVCNIDCHKTKTKIISLANHNKRKQHNQPIRTQSRYMQPASSMGKHVTKHDWF